MSSQIDGVKPPSIIEQIAAGALIVAAAWFLIVFGFGYWIGCLAARSALSAYRILLHYWHYFAIGVILGVVAGMYARAAIAIAVVML